MKSFCRSIYIYRDRPIINVINNSEEEVRGRVHIFIAAAGGSHGLALFCACFYFGGKASPPKTRSARPPIAFASDLAEEPTCGGACQ